MPCVKCRLRRDRHRHTFDAHARFSKQPPSPAALAGNEMSAPHRIDEAGQSVVCHAYYGDAILHRAHGALRHHVDVHRRAKQSLARDVDEKIGAVCRGGPREAAARDLKADRHRELKLAAAAVAADREAHDLRAGDANGGIAQQRARQRRAHAYWPAAERHVLGVGDHVDLVVATDDRALRRDVVG